jgi:hypothetical protein
MVIEQTSRRRGSGPDVVATRTDRGGLPALNTDKADPNEIGNEAEFVDDAIDDDEVEPDGQLLPDRKELNELGLELDNPEGLADE